jgi:Zn-dependent M28 family amino/carboxypeptidase
VVNATQPAMYLTDPSLRESPDHFFSASIDLAIAERLFAGSGHTYAEVAALADASAGVPRFDLSGRLTAKVVTQKASVTSANIVARLDGADPKLKGEYVVVSAHLDHLGIGQPINGDALFNGAMDNASGVASVLDIAERLKAGKRPKRSVLFVLVTAEEKGELGSHQFAERPPVPKGSIVADLNFDMPLPLWPLKSVIVLGDAESTLGAVARQVSAQQKLPIAPDPLPDRNSFTRSDQYSFVKAGIPALAFKFGFALNTPEFEIEKQWRATRYHAPSDDLDQPNIHKADAVRLDAYVAGIAAAIANAPSPPQWLATSAFNPSNAKP